jgi:hypothetical protein
MSGTEMLLSECIFFAVWTRGAFTCIVLASGRQHIVIALTLPGVSYAKNVIFS